MDQENGTRTDRVAELHRQLETQVAELVSGEDWARMLATAARFHTYSANNVMLILSQRPDATRVAGYQTWRTLGRQVRKGERGIAILAPVVVRSKKQRQETDAVQVVEDDGEVVIGFKIAHVFDIAQTDGEPIPEAEKPSLLQGEAPPGCGSRWRRRSYRRGSRWSAGGATGPTG